MNFLENLETSWIAWAIGVGGVFLGLIVLKKMLIALGKFLIFRTNPIHAWEAKPEWDALNRLARRYANQLKCAPPKLYVLESLTPNGFVLANGRNAPATIIFSRALLQTLTYKELETFLLLAIVRGKNREFRNQSMVYLLSFPLIWLRNHSPRLLNLFFDPIIAAFISIFLKPRRVFKSDIETARLLVNKDNLSQTLHRVGTVVKKTRPTMIDISLEPMFLLPTHHPEAPFHFTYSQPSVEARVDNLLRHA